MCAVPKTTVWQCDSVAVCVRYMLFSFSSPTCPGYEVMYALYRVYGTDYISMSCYKSHLSILQQNASSSINWAQNNNYKIVKIRSPHFVHSSPACCYGAFTRKDPPSSTSLCSVSHMVQWRWWATHHSCIRRWETAKYSLVPVGSFTSWLWITYNWPEMKTLWTLPTWHMQLPSSEVALTLLWVEELWTLGRPCGRPQ